jgi:hypothetical protein
MSASANWLQVTSLVSRVAIMDDRTNKEDA